MRFKEIENILPRNQNEGVNDLLNNFSALIDDAINFGTHLLKWDAEKNREGDENMPPLLFLRNILELGDAISILIKNSSIDPCKSLLRSLLENTFGLEYMLKQDWERRALSYIIWNTHKSLTLFEKLDSSSQGGIQFKKEIEKDKLVESADFIFDNPDLIQAKKNAQSLLTTLKYAPIEAEYQSTILKKKNPEWYTLFEGPNNVEQLAKHLNMHASYEVFYRGFSGNVHATNVFERKLIPNGDGTTAIVQIRYPEDAQSVTQNLISILMIAFLSFYKSRIPEKNKDFQDWYQEFRKPFLELAKDNYLNITY